MRVPHHYDIGTAFQNPAGGILISQPPGIGKLAARQTAARARGQCRQPYSHGRMQAAVQPLIDTVAQHGAEKPVEKVAGQQPVAVHDMQALPLQRSVERVVVDMKTDLRPQKRAEGEIVIPRHIVQLGPGAPKIGKRTEYREKITPHERSVLYPEIEDITDQEKLPGGTGNTLQKTNEVLLADFAG